ncbi:MAG: holo-ACP synthase [Treponema sp.]|nr:holo-ACP synthase [Treponema sp.]
MIFGIGTDISKVSRFKSWVEKPEMLERFFNKEEIISGKNFNFLCEHYAARFAAKEAFSKALGTGITGFPLTDVYIKNEASGKPDLLVINQAREVLEKLCGKCKIHVSLSHEKEFAIAYVIIEKED